MSKFWHGFLHVVAMALQVGNAVTTILPEKYKVLAAGIIAFLQGILAYSQHG